MEGTQELNAGPGWYHFPGDASDTVRYWNGLGWSPPHQVGANREPWRIGEPAPLVHRVVARIIDLGLANLIGLTVSLFVRYRIDIRDTDWTANFAYQSVAAIVAVFVWETFWHAIDGATPGKQVMKLWVVRDRDPERPLGAWAVLRNLHRVLYVVPLLLVAEPAASWAVAAGVAFAFGALSLGLAVFDTDRHRTPADWFAGTSVRRAPQSSLRFSGWVGRALAIIVPALIIGGVWIHRTNHQEPERVTLAWLDAADGPAQDADALRTDLCGVRTGAFELLEDVPVRESSVVSTVLSHAVTEEAAWEPTIGEDGPIDWLQFSRERRTYQAVVVGEVTLLVDRTLEMRAFEAILVTEYDEDVLEPRWLVCGLTLAPDVSDFLGTVEAVSDS